MNTEHEKAAVKLARDRGEVCPWCRSAEFLAIADSRPQPYQDGSADLRMQCGRVPHPYPAPEQPWSVKLSAADLQKKLLSIKRYEPVGGSSKSKAGRRDPYARP